MRKVFCFIMSLSLIVALSHPASAQPGGGFQLGNIFQGGAPPPGVASVVGRSFAGVVENGTGSSLAMLAAVDSPEVRQELGMTDAEANAIRAVRMQIMMSAPQYINRLRNFNPEDGEKLQQDIGRDLERFAASVNQAIPPERKAKIDKLAFQAMGGVDSPFIMLDTMGVLNLSEDQKGKMQSIFNEMREERMAHIEAGLAMAEKVIAAGGPENLSPELRAELERERVELEAKVLATSGKLSDRLRQNLTPEQLKLEQELLASRPDFLPGLPQQWQRGGRRGVEQGGRGSSFYVPGAGSWRPGMPMSEPTQEPQRRNRSPRGEEE
jgi:hypothetical protein